jgi:hypothetical protein
VRRFLQAPFYHEPGEPLDKMRCLLEQGFLCMGPVTRAGCGALCPSLGRDCYGCYGPAESPNTDALAARFGQLGLAPLAVMQRFQSINSRAPAFLAAAEKARMAGDE